VARTGEITEHERLRRRAGFSVTGFGTATGYSHTYVSRVESGDLRPSSEYRRKAAKVLRVPERLLFGEEDGHV
jgi:transcriptional regulator with XRE-family HTH domain